MTFSVILSRLSIVSSAKILELGELLWCGLREWWENSKEFTSEI